MPCAACGGRMRFPTAPDRTWRRPPRLSHHAQRSARPAATARSGEERGRGGAPAAGCTARRRPPPPAGTPACTAGVRRSQVGRKRRRAGCVGAEECAGDWGGPHVHHLPARRLPQCAPLFDRGRPCEGLAAVPALHLACRGWGCWEGAVAGQQERGPAAARRRRCTHDAAGRASPAVNVLSAVQRCPTVCRIFCATANPTAGALGGPTAAAGAVSSEGAVAPGGIERCDDAPCCPPPAPASGGGAPGRAARHPGRARRLLPAGRGGRVGCAERGSGKGRAGPGVVGADSGVVGAGARARCGRGRWLVGVPRTIRADAAPEPDASLLPALRRHQGTQGPTPHDWVQALTLFLAPWGKCGCPQPHFPIPASASCEARLVGQLPLPPTPIPHLRRCLCCL